MDPVQEILDTANLSEEQMRTVIKRLQQKLKQSKEQQKTAAEPPNQTQPRPSKNSRRKRMLRAEDKILKLFLYVMDRFKAQGFFYGIVNDNGSVVTASSDALRGWLQETVCFSRAGPEQIARYNSNYNKDSTNADIGPKSLKELSDATLGSMISALIRYCDPPQKMFPLKKGAPPPWWPTTEEDWWAPSGFPTDQGPVPYKKPHDLKKAWKAGILAAVIKHLMPRTSTIAAVIRQSKRLQHRMSAKENKIWMGFVAKEEEAYVKSLQDLGENNEDANNQRPEGLMPEGYMASMTNLEFNSCDQSSRLQSFGMVDNVANFNYNLVGVGVNNSVVYQPQPAMVVTEETNQSRVQCLERCGFAALSPFFIEDYGF